MFWPHLVESNQSAAKWPAHRLALHTSTLWRRHLGASLLCRWGDASRLSFLHRQQFHLRVFEAVLDALHFVVELINLALHTLALE